MRYIRLRLRAPKTWWRDFAISVMLFLGCWAVYSPLMSANFIDIDDAEYVRDNPNVLGGPSWVNIVWALTADHASNWHPVTWWSHQLDIAVWGLDPHGHHATSVFLHGLNAVLVYLLFHSLTEERVLAAVVAAFFAFHPINVETVAWISERKSLLSTSYGLLALLAYGRFALQRRLRSYLLVTLFYGLSLSSKPMLVTLPFVMLLLDYWPLRRFGLPWTRDVCTDASTAQLLKAVFEKLPWFAMSAVVCLVTMSVQHGARADSSALAIPWRLGNAVVALVGYLGMLFWPVGFAVAYPHPLGSLSIGKILASAVSLLLVTMLACRTSDRYWRVGWFWYVGTLIPVLGLVQVGKQAMADRYVYWPALGIFLVVASAGKLSESQFGSRLWLSLVGVLLLVLSALTFRQAERWQTSLSLMEHSLKVCPENHIAAYLAGIAYSDRRENIAARACFERAVALGPLDLQAGLAFARFLSESGELPRSLSEYDRLLRIYPDSTEVRLWRGIALARLGSFDAAHADFQRALTNGTTAADGEFNLGLLEWKRGNRAEANVHWRKCLAVNPLHVEALVAIADAARASGESQHAERALSKALESHLDPRVVVAMVHVQKAKGDPRSASEYLQKGLRAHPDSPLLWHLQGAMEMQRGSEAEAAVAFKNALRFDESYLPAANDLAWLLSTTPDDEHCDGALALRLAKQVAAATGDDPAVLDTLAAASAAAGEFEMAVADGQKALNLAQQRNLRPLVKDLQKRLQCYRNGKRYTRGRVN